MVVAPLKSRHTCRNDAGKAGSNAARDCLKAAAGLPHAKLRGEHLCDSPPSRRERADIILLRFDGIGVQAAAKRLNTMPQRVSTWSGRFTTLGLDGLADRPGRGRKASIAAAKVASVITEATGPPRGRGRWGTVR